VFDHPFFVLLNVAVGGNWPGSPDGTTRFPQTMLVDYVRFYQRRTAESGHRSRSMRRITR
jgi:beta-glucanase (GH16 family)